MKKNETLEWLEGINYEVAFWNNVYRWKHTFDGMMGWSHYGGIIDLECFDANSYLTNLPAGKGPKILDVGSGMSYALGNMMGDSENPKPLDIHYIDPLASYFNKILERYKRPLPKIEFGMMEYLSKFHPQHDADLIVIQNALDHSSQPMKGILEAIDTLKTGGILYLNHHPNEAETEHYKGFHKYNIQISNGQLSIWNKEESINVGEVIKDFAQIETKRNDNGHVIAIIKKTKERPQNSDTSDTDIQQLCKDMIDYHQKNGSLWYSLKRQCQYWKYNTIQFCVQALTWKQKMMLKRIIKQA